MFFFFQAEDGIRDADVTGVQTCALPIAIRMQTVLHPWVAFLVMPIFALANAGISLDGIDLTQGGSLWVTAGVAIALVVGKPAGIIGASWLAVKLEIGRAHV